jgi:hypothetical protein
MAPDLVLVLKPHQRQPHRPFRCLPRRELVYTGRQPLCDGARLLLSRGHDPATLMTVRRANRSYAQDERGARHSASPQLG